MITIIAAIAKALGALVLVLTCLCAGLALAITSTPVPHQRPLMGNNRLKERRCRPHWRQTAAGLRGMLYPSAVPAASQQENSRLVNTGFVIRKRLAIAATTSSLWGNDAMKSTDEKNLLEDRDALPPIRTAASSASCVHRKRKLPRLDPLPSFAKRRSPRQEVIETKMKELLIEEKKERLQEERRPGEEDAAIENEDSVQFPPPTVDRHCSLLHEQPMLPLAPPTTSLHQSSSSLKPPLPQTTYPFTGYPMKPAPGPSRIISSKRPTSHLDSVSISRRQLTSDPYQIRPKRHDRLSDIMLIPTMSLELACQYYLPETRGPCSLRCTPSTATPTLSPSPSPKEEIQLQPAEDQDKESHETMQSPDLLVVPYAAQRNASTSRSPSPPPRPVVLPPSRSHSSPSSLHCHHPQPHPVVCSPRVSEHQSDEPLSNDGPLTSTSPSRTVASSSRDTPSPTSRDLTPVSVRSSAISSGPASPRSPVPLSPISPGSPFHVAVPLPSPISPASVAAPLSPVPGPAQLQPLPPPPAPAAVVLPQALTPRQRLQSDLKDWEKKATERLLRLVDNRRSRGRALQPYVLDIVEKIKRGRSGIRGLIKNATCDNVDVIREKMEKVSDKLLDLFSQLPW